MPNKTRPDVVKSGDMGPAKMHRLKRCLPEVATTVNMIANASKKNRQPIVPNRNPKFMHCLLGETDATRLFGSRGCVDL
jgi:hypothetical protein